jgi:hypothetical protein
MSSPLNVIQCPIKPVRRVSTLTLPTTEELTNHQKCRYHAESEEPKVGLDDVFPGEDIDYKQNDCKEPELAERCPAEIWLGRKSEGGRL